MQYFYKKNRILYLCLLLCLIMSGCQSQGKNAKEKKEYHIAVITKSRSGEYWMSVNSGIEKAAEDYGVSVTVLSPDSETDEARQTKMIYDLIDKGVDALAISPVNSYGAQDYVNYAKDKGVELVSFDARIAEEGVPYIGIDNEEAGYEAGKEMAKKMGHQGTIGIIAGDQRQIPHKARVEGFKRYIEEEPSMQVAFVEVGYSNSRVPAEKLAELFQENQELGGLFITSGMTAFGVVEYLGNTSLCIGSVDAQSDVLEKVKEGQIAVLVSQNGYDIGYQTVKSMVRGLEVQNIKGKILSAEIVTPETIDKE